MDDDFDVIVLGAGSTGTNVAWYARDDGLSVAVVEADRLPGPPGGCGSGLPTSFDQRRPMDPRLSNAGMRPVRHSKNRQADRCPGQAHPLEVVVG